MVVEAIAYQKLDQRLAALLVGKTANAHPHHPPGARGRTGERARDRLAPAAQLEDRGWVDLGRERVRIVDRAALENLARG